MCGRFTLTSNLDDLQGRFGFVAGPLDDLPRYNVAPTQQVLAVVNDGQRRAELLRWGLIPFWAKDPKIGYRMINAVGETLATKPAFRAAFRRRRCLVLADGFFEWRKEGNKKIPTYIFLKSREPFAFAGIWEVWKALDGETVRSCAIVTTKPNAFMEQIHHRMPVILSEETEALWLDPMTEEASVLAPLLMPSPPELMDSYLVSDLVNSPKNHGPECIEQLSPS
jgi:putative SOS response-associated peptidase YedK